MINPIDLNNPLQQELLQAGQNNPEAEAPTNTGRPIPDLEVFDRIKTGTKRCLYIPSSPPPSPPKKKHKAVPIFENDFSPSTKSPVNMQMPLKVGKRLSLANTYSARTTDGITTRTVVRGCRKYGYLSTAFLMLLTDLRRQAPPHPLELTAFWGKFRCFTRSEEIISLGEEIGIQMKKVDLVGQQKIYQLETLAEHAPLIVSISPYLPLVQKGRHWIVIDKIDNDFVLIRDPVSGLAYKPSLRELRANLMQGNEQCIYLANNT